MRVWRVENIDGKIKKKQIAVAAVLCSFCTVKVATISSIQLC